jgi:hypothetical protein
MDSPEGVLEKTGVPKTDCEKAGVFATSYVRLLYLGASEFEATVS